MKVEIKATVTDDAGNVVGSLSGETIYEEGFKAKRVSCNSSSLGTDAGNKKKSKDAIRRLCDDVCWRIGT